MKLIKVGAQWCGKCKILEKRLESIPDDYEIESLDVETDFEKVDKLPKIKTLPMMFIVDDDEQVLHTLVGLLTTAEIIQHLENYK